MWAQKIREVVGGDRLVGAAWPFADGRTWEAAEWPEGISESRSSGHCGEERGQSWEPGRKP